MPKWLDTRGKPSIAIGICARCSFKRAYSDLKSDPNFPGLFVCRTVADGCLDVFDPWRLAARQTENITLIHGARPDVSIALDSNGNPVQPN